MSSEPRTPEALAEVCRGMARELRHDSTNLLSMMNRRHFREARAQLMEEIAAVLEAPEVVGNLKALKILLRGVDG